MTDLLWHLLTQPPGAPGSARARYAAAMALHGAGALTWRELEAYREATAFDAQDPACVLQDRGLRPPVARPLAAAALLALLLAEIDRYLATRAGPGIAEVRGALAPAFQAAIRPGTNPPNLVAETCLPAALAALERDDPALARAIAAAAPHLGWTGYDAYDPSAIGPVFPRSHAFGSLVGAAAPVAARDFDLGLFLIAPRVLYRDHAHAAPELYVPLTGPHRWRFAPGAAFRERPAHGPVWNPPHRPHAIVTGDVPFLAIFAWTRDVEAPAYVIPAPDWAAYEA
ncbi:MAG: hypothetical protein IAE87_00165 [Rhodobacteraceae bacterium]|jgi:hypothetical protein|nr:hypothetical protein [Paracoccaceae bacterium]